MDADPHGPPDAPPDAQNPLQTGALCATGQMVTSPLIAALAADLALAQGEMKAPLKDRIAKITSAAARYEYHYADLTAIIEAIQGPFSRHGLAYVQTLKMCPDGVFALITRLVHASGQWIESEYPIALSNKQTELGSAITFARRYSLQTLAGISASEDMDSTVTDGKAAEVADRPKPAGRSAGTAPSPPPPVAPPPPPAAEEPAAPPARPQLDNLINEEQRAELQAAAKAGGHSVQAVKAWLLTEYGVKGSAALKTEQYATVLWRLSDPAPLVVTAKGK